MTHPLLFQQIRQHLGDRPSLPATVRKLLGEIAATYRELESKASSPLTGDTPQLSLSAIFRSMADGVLVRDIDGKIIEHNRAAEKLLGLTFAQVRGQAPLPPGWKLVREDGGDIPREQKPSRETLRDGCPRSGVILGLVTPGMELRWLSINSEPLHEASGRLIAAVSTFSDVTEVLSLQPRFAQTRTQPILGSPEEPAPTLATIARRLGVTTATVSMALHNHPRISEVTREKAKAMAQELGYRPDPHLRRAMAHLRRGRKSAFRSVLHALTDLPSLEGRYITDMIAAAKNRADLLGYGFAVEQIAPTRLGSSNLTRTLLHRGVEGVLLLPMSTPWHHHTLLQWSRFSVVATNYSVCVPDFDRVVGDLLACVQGAFAQLRALGYRRIGVVLNASFDKVASHRLSAALACETARYPESAVQTFVYRAPLLSALVCQLPVLPQRAATASSAEEDAGQNFGQALSRWYLTEQPDALLVDSENVAELVLRELGLSAPESIGVALLHRTADSRFAGWEERAATVGETSIDLLDHKIRTFERGEPTSPLTRRIKGAWHHGDTVRSRSGQT